MSRAGSIIEINGTSYDASAKVTSSVKKLASRVKQPKVIDGFVRQSSAPVKTKTQVQPQPVKQSRQARSAKAVHSRAQKSRALMRTIVPKPKATEPKLRKLIKPSVSKAVDFEQERRSRASAIVKDKRVKRFGLSTAQAPELARPKITAKTRPMNLDSQNAAAVSRPLPSMMVSASHQKLERMLDEALVAADAHKQMLKRQSKNPFSRLSKNRRWLVALVAVLALILLAAALIWRSMPAVAIKVISKETHVNASLPAYAPAGFAVASPIGHSSGSVTVKYQNGSYNYDITQKSSSWDSASLAANVLDTGSQTQTSQVQGTTVYIYGASNNATWVNNGVWYTLKNNASLSSDQILRIVQSM